MTRTEYLWRAAQRFEPELWDWCASGQLPEHAVDDVISASLERTEECLKRHDMVVTKFEISEIKHTRKRFFGLIKETNYTYMFDTK